MCLGAEQCEQWYASQEIFFRLLPQLHVTFASVCPQDTLNLDTEESIEHLKEIKLNTVEYLMYLLEPFPRQKAPSSGHPREVRLVGTKYYRLAIIVVHFSAK